ncbi:MAG: hypothetical protein A2508_02130 [Candidatus Lambdaproteobacteria bacterium RIFOXYD12_FULL_49_8]|uniref:Protein MgtC n=1 Tax=Candidatus Lambdaproteobacteria bacterium RIFOXYD2_FULL_50_16 TaxID=1817772 RepID=A0A1F6GEK2_9PROT|nr:MAG: hypothetical protein A2527_01260 [Candidatus Lambdaproteobacteria bacterium RIFOXYD2_FULL_50_16]OGG97820.1 MAG: hypothetical protein A2508_02130 [Candidatus Lambdaproteobacteria bacterium RIFOXYD12_FULL_49_8]
MVETVWTIWNPEPLHWASMGAVFLSGGMIGLERQLSGKPVGIRTSILICLGTYAFIALGRTLPYEGIIDHSRILGQVITGIGFLGAGVMFSRDGTVVGVTSAATIWLLAAIGAFIGMDHARTGLLLGVIGSAVLVGVDRIEVYSVYLQRGVHRRLIQRRRGNRTGAKPPKDNLSK